MTIKSTKYISPITSLTLYFLYICLLLTCLCCLNGCSKTEANLSSQKRGSEEVVLPDSDPRVVANTPSHVLANKLYKKFDGANSKTVEASGFTPLNVDHEIIANRVPRTGEFTKFGETEDTQLVTLQTSRAKNVRVTCTVRVVKLMIDDLKGKKHQRFLVKLSNNTTVLVAHNLDLAPKVPIVLGDIVEICGEYIWNEKGGVLHYTHHTTNRRHSGGYIMLNGKKYK